MKNSIYTKREVPVMHPGCSMAETGAGDWDDFDNPLGEFNIIPEGKESLLVRNVDEYRFDGETQKEVYYTLPSEIEKPSSIRDESVITVFVPSDVHPFSYLKEIGIDITKAAWIFLHKDVIDVLRKLPWRHYLDTVAYGEFFRFEDFDTVSLQKVEYFPEWKVILEGKVGEQEFYRPDTPEYIIELVMEK